jgi:phospholipid/cholesterol/gamma-HCH transport system substrate-binding protein
MEKKPPTVVQGLVIVGFVLSCFGLALLLWVSFGGPTPLRPESYQIKVPVTEATQLADQSDVRISGVNVGKVVNIDLPPAGGTAMATLSIDERFAPLPADVQATLRAKTLLGETYIELTPGTADGPQLAEGATLSKAQVSKTVQIDEVVRTFDPKTRAALRSWLRDSAIAIDGRGQSLSNAFGELAPTFSGFDKVFRTLNTQETAVRQLFANGAITFDALSRRRGELRSLIESSNTVIQTTARRDQDLIDIFRAFPTFLRESRLTLARLRSFALNADPLVVQLIPAARELSPTLIDIGRLAPQLRGFFNGLGPVIDRSPRAFPAFRQLFRDDFPPLLRSLDPFLRSLNPMLQAIGSYKHELSALVANAAATTNGVSLVKRDRVHYLRTLSLLSPESVATYPGRLRINRNNAYSKPGIYSKLAAGLPNFDTSQCTGGVAAQLDPSAATDPAFTARTDGDAADAQDFFDRLQLFAFDDQLSTNDVPAPPSCKQQQPFAPFGAQGARTAYPHVVQQAK